LNNLQTSSLSLGKNNIHLWYTRPKLHLDAALLARYKELLTDSEIEKQQRYIFEKDRHDALITRAFVRDLLAKYIDKLPTEFEFSKGDKGKPEIVNANIPLRFNISHTNNLIICAVTLNHDIGCDVEYTERKSDVLAIADRFFSQQEVEELFSLPKAEQRQRFFDYWTLKESYIKAWGQGLAIPLSDFSFHIKGAQIAMLNNDISLSFAASREDNTEHWQSWLFYPDDDYRVALSIRDISSSNRVFRQSNPQQLRFFESTPLIGYKEVDRIKL